MIGDMSRAVSMMSEATEELNSIVKRDLEGLLAEVLESVKMNAPVLTGAFRDSLMPYRGNVDSNQSRRIRRHEHGGMTPHSVMASWRPGQEFGIVSYLPYANRLATGWSAQQAEGWIDLVIQTVAANREERRG